MPRIKSSAARGTEHEVDAEVALSDRLAGLLLTISSPVSTRRGSSYALARASRDRPQPSRPPCAASRELVRVGESLRGLPSATLVRFLVLLQITVTAQLM